MFIIEGIPAVLLGVVCLFVLTDRPAQARWLSPDERGWLQKRVDGDSKPRAKLAHGSLWQVLFSRHVLILSLVLAGSMLLRPGAASVATRDAALDKLKTDHRRPPSRGALGGAREQALLPSLERDDYSAANAL